MSLYFTLQWCHVSIMVSQIIDTLTVVQQFVHINKTQTSKLWIAGRGQRNKSMTWSKTAVSLLHYAMEILQSCTKPYTYHSILQINIFWPFWRKCFSHSMVTRQLGQHDYYLIENGIFCSPHPRIIWAEWGIIMPRPHISMVLNAIQLNKFLSWC